MLTALCRDRVPNLLLLVIQPADLISAYVVVIHRDIAWPHVIALELDIHQGLPVDVNAALAAGCRVPNALVADGASHRAP